MIRTVRGLLSIDEAIRTLFFGDTSAFRGVAELFVAQTESICRHLDEVSASQSHRALALLLHELATSLDIVGARDSGPLMRRHEARLKRGSLTRAEVDAIRDDARQHLLQTSEFLQQWLRDGEMGAAARPRGKGPTHR